MKNKTALYRALSAAGMVASLCMFAPAYADEIADVGKLAKAGKVVEALSKANEYLAKHPADPQMRFMKGVLLTEQNKSEEAIAVFTKLTEDYKDLPEPYNNLAVLYAASGQYDKARIALEKAIRTNPSYMTAYENLGDVYGKMASQAYDKALALGANNTPAKSRLTLLRSFSSTTGVKGSVPELPPAAPAPAPAAAPAPAPATQVAQAGRPAAPPLISQIPADSGKNTMLARIPALSVTPPPAAAAAKPAPAPVPLPVPAPAPAAAKPAVPVPLPVPVPAKQEPAKPAPAPAKPEPAKVEPPKPAKPEAPKPAKPDTSDRDAVLAQVNGWAKAWAAQNVDSYLGYYSRDFEPPKGMTHKAWAEERRSRIEGKGRIRVEVASPEVVITGNTAKVSFRQTYESDRLTARSRKVLVLTKNGGKWQIKQESSGS
ncbi:L,D-transpeptidase Cds6 family protein [Duganella qianjiadongensis]|uniref:Tetratricopeptide repeat protein n=1 Tax=Duganella qianjiadongensis TaxID=2692176 RepID=A0ABW9VP47_9BURK|nr:tetratricopeptide repeat protein [Duganella qianjiadongensis]MYM40390.1 tetratricopeptide repeat protein [Duganella qianjiadongensis]